MLSEQGVWGKWFEQPKILPWHRSGPDREGYISVLMGIHPRSLERQGHDGMSCNLYFGWTKSSSNNTIRWEWIGNIIRKWLGGYSTCVIRGLTLHMPWVWWADTRMNGHLDTVYRILWYLKGTLGKRLWFSKSEHLKVDGYSDSNWASCQDSRRLTSIYCVFLGENLVPWRSKKQTIVSRWTTEA